LSQECCLWHWSVISSTLLLLLYFQCWIYRNVHDVFLNVSIFWLIDFLQQYSRSGQVYIPAVPAYEVYISQLIRYSRWLVLTRKLLNQYLLALTLGICSTVFRKPSWRYHLTITDYLGHCGYVSCVRFPSFHLSWFFTAFFKNNGTGGTTLVGTANISKLSDFIHGGVGFVLFTLSNYMCYVYMSVFWCSYAYLFCRGYMVCVSLYN
jgi:hypothetical protein